MPEKKREEMEIKAEAEAAVAVETEILLDTGTGTEENRKRCKSCAEKDIRKGKGKAGENSKSMTGIAGEKKPGFEIKHDDNTAIFERDILKENPPKFSYLTRLFRYVFSSAKLMCGIYLGLAVILSILQPITAFIWGKYIDNANALAESADVQTIQLVSLIGLSVLYWLISFICNLLNRYLYGGEDIERLSRVQEHRLQEKFHAKMFRKISRLYPDYMEVPRINDIIERSFNSMGGEWSSLQRGVMIEGYVIIAKLVSVVMTAASLYIFHPLLCVIVLIAPVPTLYTTYIGNRLSFRFVRNNSRILREAGYYQGVLLGADTAKEVKVLNLFDFFFAKWQSLADDYAIRERKNQMNVFLLGSLSGFISNAANVGANVLAIVLLAQGKISIGALGAVLSLISTLMWSTSQLFGSIANFVSKKHEAAQFFEIIDLDEQPMDGTNCKAFGGKAADGRIACGKTADNMFASGAIGNGRAADCGTASHKVGDRRVTGRKVKSRKTVTEGKTSKTSGNTAAIIDIESLETRNISYRYPLTDEFRIRNVNFKIRKGEKVAFVGENGAGKTTFVKLLTGMLQPTCGELLINGINAKEFGFGSRYNSTSCVFQEPARFNTFTVADNVYLGDVERERDEAGIDSALAFAGFDGADRDAMLGKDIGGTELSGGQWQKIAIARAYYRNRDFYILDEPTSNLDPLAEAEVFKKYIAMTEGKTVIMVTHRISVASLADRIVVFRDGEIVEDGTHDELLSRNGEYARLYSVQAQWYDR